MDHCRFTRNTVVFVLTFGLVFIFSGNAHIFADTDTVDKIEAASETLPPLNAQETKEMKSIASNAEKVLVSKEVRGASVAEVKMVTKTMSGEVGAISGSGLAFIYEKEAMSESEIWFPFQEELELRGYKNTREIEAGDRILIKYDEAEDQSKRLLKGIKLERKKEKTDEDEELPPVKVRRVFASGVSAPTAVGQEGFGQ